MRFDFSSWVIGSQSYSWVPFFLLLVHNRICSLEKETSSHNRLKSSDFLAAKWRKARSIILSWPWTTPITFQKSSSGGIYRGSRFSENLYTTRKGLRLSFGKWGMNFLPQSHATLKFLRSLFAGVSTPGLALLLEKIQSNGRCKILCKAFRTLEWVEVYKFLDRKEILILTIQNERVSIGSKREGGFISQSDYVNVVFAAA